MSDYHALCLHGRSTVQNNSLFQTKSDLQVCLFKKDGQDSFTMYLYVYVLLRVKTSKCYGCLGEKQVVNHSVTDACVLKDTGSILGAFTDSLCFTFDVIAAVLVMKGD
jgi:hypothetical protein